MLPPIALLFFLHINPHTTHNSSIRSDEGLMFEMSAFQLITVASLHFQLSWYNQITIEMKLVQQNLLFKVIYEL